MSGWVSLWHYKDEKILYKYKVFRFRFHLYDISVMQYIVLSNICKRVAFHSWQMRWEYRNKVFFGESLHVLYLIIIPDTLYSPEWDSVSWWSQNLCGNSVNDKICGMIFRVLWIGLKFSHCCDCCLAGNYAKIRKARMAHFFKQSLAVDDLHNKSTKLHKTECLGNSLISTHKEH